MGRRIIIYLLCMIIVILCWFEVKMVTGFNVPRDAKSVFHLYGCFNLYFYGSPELCPLA